MVIHESQQIMAKLDIRNRYVLAYSPKVPTFDGKYHRIRVEVDNSDSGPRPQLPWRRVYTASSSRGELSKTIGWYGDLHDAQPRQDSVERWSRKIGTGKSASIRRSDESDLRTMRRNPHPRVGRYPAS